MEQSLVYFIQSKDTGLIKIGFARNPEKRLREIQRMSPSELEILIVVPGGGDRERELHKRFANVRSHGEWFFPDGELAGYIVKHQKEHRTTAEVEEAVMERLSVHLPGGTYGDTSYMIRGS